MDEDHRALGQSPEGQCRTEARPATPVFARHREGEDAGDDRERQHGIEHRQAGEDGEDREAGGNDGSDTLETAQGKMESMIATYLAE